MLDFAGEEGSYGGEELGIAEPCLDLFLFGKTSALVRNNGQAGFAELPGAFPFVDGTAIDAVRIDAIADTQGMDLAVAYADRPGVLYRDRLGGTYEAVPLAVVLNPPA